MKLAVIKTVFGLLTANKNAAIGIVVSVVIVTLLGVGWYNYNSLQNEIEERDKVIIELTSQKAELHATLNFQNAQIDELTRKKDFYEKRSRLARAEVDLIRKQTKDKLKDFRESTKTPKTCDGSIELLRSWKR